MGTIYITWILTEVKTSVKLYFCGHILFLYARHNRFFQSISATRSNEVKRLSCWKCIVSALSQTLICVCLTRAVCAICLRWTFSSAEVRQKVYTVCVCWEQHLGCDTGFTPWLMLIGLCGNCFFEWPFFWWGVNGQFWKGWSILGWVTLISAQLHMTGRERNGIKHQRERLEIGLKKGADCNFMKSSLCFFRKWKKIKVWAKMKEEQAVPSVKQGFSVTLLHLPREHSASSSCHTDTHRIGCSRSLHKPDFILGLERLVKFPLHLWWFFSHHIPPSSPFKRNFCPKFTVGFIRIFIFYNL